MNQETRQRFMDGVHSRDPVAGLTHGFYRYPARFSPLFVRAAIEAFTNVGDVIMDPFMGGATTAVEALALGRRVIGVDVNALAIFIARAKTLVLSEVDLAAIRRWAARAVADVSLHDAAARPLDWIELGYQRNLTDRSTWRIRKWIELMLVRLQRMGSNDCRTFGRALILKTAQWALDCRSEIPTINRVRRQFLVALEAMVDGARAFRTATEQSACIPVPLFFNRSAVGIEKERAIAGIGAPRLIITSPPYPGVHVVYHRWQILGRRETPAPFWIADSLDGNGPSYYAFGDRHQPGLTDYFQTARDAFTSLARIADKRTTAVQMVAFSDPSWQLPLYLDTMAAAGFREVQYASIANNDDGRVWRTVPNRKWYADKRGQIAASNEVVLFHKLR